MSTGPQHRPVDGVITRARRRGFLGVRFGRSQVDVEVDKIGTVELDIFSDDVVRRAVVDGNYDIELHSKVTGVPVADIRRLYHMRETMSVSRTPGADGFYTLEGGRKGNSPLAILPGTRHDHNDAFTFIAQDFDIRLPNGRRPTLDEVAIFGAHGGRFGFDGLSTRDAARVIVDSVRGRSRGGPTRIRYALLDSCHQGSPRYLVVGKTNAQAMQDHIDARLIQLGLDPAGPERIVVLAPDRPGSIYAGSPATVKVYGKHETVPFTTAANQNAWRYPKDMSRYSLVVAGFVVGSGAAVTTILTRSGVAEWYRENRDHVLGWVFGNTSAPAGTP